VRYQNAQLDIPSPTIYHTTWSATPVGSWPEMVRFGSKVVKYDIKMFSSINWIQWCITLGSEGLETSLDPNSPFHPFFTKSKILETLKLILAMLPLENAARNFFITSFHLFTSYIFYLAAFSRGNMYKIIFEKLFST